MEGIARSLCASAPSGIEDQRMAQITQGIERFVAERVRLYDDL
jgi:hypothetical protein